MNVALQEALAEFLECSIHSILYVRGIYPASLFEQRQYLGVSIWQSRHPEINAYVRRVLDNAKPLLVQGLVDRVVVVTTSAAGKPIDHISIKCAYTAINAQSANTVYIDRPEDTYRATNELDMSTVYEELRSAILRLGLLDAQLPRLPEGCTWTTMVVTSANDTNEAGDGVLQATLSSGQWYIDNNQLAEQLSLAQRSAALSASDGSGSSSSSSSGGGAGNVVNINSSVETVSAGTLGAPRLVPIKSFRNGLINMSIYAHVFS